MYIKQKAELSFHESSRILSFLISFSSVSVR